MGDCLQAGKPSWYVTSHPGQLSLAIPPCVGAMSTSESWDVNRHTARCTSPVSVVWQCKLVSGWGLMKRRSAPLYGPYGSRRTSRYSLYLSCLSATIRLWSAEVVDRGVYCVMLNSSGRWMRPKEISIVTSNSIFGNLGRAASEEVVLYLIKTKCLPVLLYGLEVFSLT